MKIAQILGLRLYIEPTRNPNELLPVQEFYDSMLYVSVDHKYSVLLFSSYFLQPHEKNIHTTKSKESNAPKIMGESTEFVSRVVWLNHFKFGE